MPDLKLKAKISVENVYKYPQIGEVLVHYRMGIGSLDDTDRFFRKVIDLA